jgi:4-methyl-5(b-hydroxyethyl)-thiazole monophosphate biosynthesis
MHKRALVPIADGVEDIETVAIIDVLRRAGVEVVAVAVDKIQITAANGTKIVADELLQECVKEKFDLIALPGGMPGAENLRDSSQLIAMLKEQQKAGRLYGAICASPAVVLQHHGLLEGRRATCHPALQKQLKNLDQARVVVDGNCVTSQGPGTAIEFALQLVELLFDASKARQIAQAMVAR